MKQVIYLLIIFLPHKIVEARSSETPVLKAIVPVRYVVELPPPKTDKGDWSARVLSNRPQETKLLRVTTRPKEEYSVINIVHP